MRVKDARVAGGEVGNENAESVGNVVLHAFFFAVVS